MYIRKGDKFLCIEDVDNVFGTRLFNKGEVYNVIYVDNEQIKVLITLNHNLIGNEFFEFDLDFINKNFTKI